MASEILTALNFTTDTTGKAAATAFYNNFIGRYSDYVFTKDDLTFLLNNFEFYDIATAGKLFAYPPFKWPDGSQTAELDNVLVAYFNGKPEYSELERKVFIRYAGAWLAFIKLNKGDAREYNKDTQENILNVMQKVYFKFEADNQSLFKEVRSSYVDFSYVSFKRDLSSAINTWFGTDPVISDIKSVYQKNHYVYFVTKKQQSQSTIKGFTTIALKQLNESQQKILKENKFFENETNFKSYAPGRSNDITLSEDLSQLNTTEGTEPSTFTEERQNVLARVYFEIVSKEMLRQNYYVLKEGITEKISLANIQKQYDFAVDASVNRNNGPVPLAFIENSTGLIGYRIAQDILNKIRHDAVKIFLKQKDAYQTQETLDKAFQKAEEAAKNNEEITGKEIDVTELSEEDIKAKQKFLKQCLLMSRLKDLERLNLNDISSKVTGTIHEKIPYKGRFYLIDEKDQNKDKSSLINKLLIPNIDSIKSFVNISPAEHASLIPKIRLVKVYTDTSGELKEHEFKFPKHINSNRVNNLFSTDFDRGSDFGVKEFSFSFDGTSPATAKNDITANLKLYFQSFDDFVKDHPMNDGHRYVDLLVLPTKSADAPTPKKVGSGNTSPIQFDPSYYRIRADVGWESESAPKHLKTAIEKINKTFYLNMVDHEIDIRDDGSVEITVSYRAYIESALKGTTLDALASREARAQLKLIREQYQQVLNSKACTHKQLTKIRRQFLQVEENLRKNAFQSIIKRLVKYNLLKHVSVDSSAADAFRRTGFISAPAVFTGIPVGTGDPIKEKSNPGDFTLNHERFKDLQLSNSKSDLLINYFFLGDLLYVILDCLYDPNDENKKINESYIRGTENFKFLLSSFQFIDQFNNSNPESVNMANIPISVELFNEWFTENVIKPERISYPVMYFIRDISKYLITEILLESCFKNDLNKTLQFKTNNFLGKRKGTEKMDPIGSLLLEQPDKTMLDVSYHYNDGSLPLSADLNGVSTSVKDLYNFITIYAESPRIKTDKVGDKFLDEMNGIIHYQLGKSRGILKKIKFSKSDMQYIREARFFRHGHDGLMQLSAVYKISMDMVGNTLYYPGMEVFIDPVGLLGAGANFDPRKQTSIANKMGFGGYHLVTSVKSSIGPGKFTTSVEALFSYSGDGDPKSRVIGSREEIEVDAIDSSKISERETQGPYAQAYCDGISGQLYKQAFEASLGKPISPIDTKPSAAVKQEVASAIVREAEITEEVEPVSPLLNPDQPDNFVEDN